jgi:hypothetical protein
MNSWQDVVALTCVVAALGWLSRYVWRRMRRRGRGCCESQWTCPRPTPPLVQIKSRRLN